MQFVLLTVMALTGADATSGVAVSPSDMYYEGPMETVAACDACDAGDCGLGVAGHWAAKKEARLARQAAKAAEWQRKHMMPQTCYQPRYGCYYSGDRHMHRYPAFHGHYYRRPYNYRHLFEYPWHAQLHEPTSLFSYNVNEGDVPLGAVEMEMQLPGTVEGPLEMEGPPVPPADDSARAYIGD